MTHMPGWAGGHTLDVGVVSEWTARVEFERARGLSRFKHTEAIVGPARSLQAGLVPAFAVIEGRALDDSS